MAGSFVDDPSESSRVRTLLLVGKTGNGKSATGNNILGSNAFKSKRSPDGVTNTTELRKTTLKDGQIINVIDTPGLFSKSADPQFVGKEIVKCIGLAKDGIHAVLVVLSTRNRVTMEEVGAIETLQSLFGDKIAEYMILVFTGGDELEDEEQELDDYLSGSEAIKGMLELCGNRRVLFDNKTKNKTKKAEQLNKLLSLVNDVVMKNGGKPFTNELFVEYQKEAAKLKSLKAKEEKSALEVQISRANEELAARLNNMIETKLMDTTRRLEQQLKDEQEARAKAEAAAQANQSKSDDEMRMLREHLERSRRELEELRAKGRGGGGGGGRRCVVM